MSKRKSGKRRKKQIRITGGVPKRPQAELMHRAMRSSPTPIQGVRVEPRNKEKMSRMVLDLAGPLIADAQGDERAYRMAVTLAIIAWNAALVPPEEQGAEIAAAFASAQIAPSTRESLRQCLCSLIERKRTLYPDVRRLILDHDLTYPKEGQAFLNVASMEL